MPFLNKIFLAAVCLSISIGGLTAQTTVLSVPGQAGQSTNVFSGEPFALRNSFTASNVAFQAISNSDGSKIYVIQRAGSDTVLVIDAVNPSTILQRFSFGSNGESATLTPNGQRLLVAAGTLRVINTANDTEVASIPVGSQPIDVAVSLDGSRAFVLSQASSTLTAVDLANNQVTGTALSVPGGATSVEVGPNGLVYVTAINRVLEIDPRTNVLRAEIPLNARPTQLQFTPDGRYAVALNETPVTGSSVLLFDLATKTLANFIPNLTVGNIVLEKLILVGNNRAYATRQGGGALYEITVSPLNINVASYSSIEPLSDVQVAGASGELPSPKYLFAATPTSLYRFSLASSILAPQGQLGLTSAPIALLTATQPSTGVPTVVLAYNTTQTLPSTGGAALPLVIRAIDSAGNPVRGAAVTFQTTNAGVSFSTVSTATDVRGFAQSSVSLPSTAGEYIVTAGVAGGQSATFTLTVGGGGSGGSGGLSIVSGNGQIVLEQFLVQNPMVVAVRDTNGAPVAGATVTFQLTTGAGTLGASTFGGIPATATCSANACTATTDAQGQASVGFFATQLTPGVNHSTATITASSGSSSVVITVVTARLSTAGNPAPPPIVELIKPLEDRVVTAQAGQTLPEAIQVRVVDANGQAITGAGLTVSTGLDASLFPSASCEGGTVLTDGTGVASCDLVVGGRIGTNVPIRVNVGGFRDLGNLVLEVTPGAPALVRILQGNSQSGNPGQRLPLALLAQITDAGGNSLPSTPVTWEVISGSATLSNTVNTSDLNGRVSTLVTLGSTAGPAQIRVRAGDAEATFTATTNIAVSGLAKVSGDTQVAQIGAAFGQPLVVAVTNEQNQPVSGISVDFAASGGATLSAPSGTTDANGRTQVNVTAGPAAGPITVSASIPSGPSASFSLTARLPGPVFSETSFFNAASNQRGISPGSLAIITVSGVAPSLNGCNVAPNFGLGALPTTFQSVQVQFGNTLAPIGYICNIDGRETIAIQVPFEMAPGLPPVVIRAGQAETIVQNVTIQPLSPGLFEHMIGERRYAVLQREDGSFVSDTNRAQRGERIRLYATGLGQTLPLTGTNRAGRIGQAVFAPVIVGINNAGVNVVSAETLPGVVGVYVVTFVVSADAPSGDTVLGLAGIGLDGQNYGAPGSIIAIQ